MRLLRIYSDLDTNSRFGGGSGFFGYVDNIFTHFL